MSLYPHPLRRRKDEKNREEAEEAEMTEQEEEIKYDIVISRND